MLVVEDSPVINKILCDSIKGQLQLEVIGAFSLAQAKAAIERYRDEFFVAILDLTLPDAPRGEVVEEVISQGIGPIILTANMSDDLHDKMMAKPIVDYAVKRNLSEMQYVIDQVKRLSENHSRRILVVDESESTRTLLTSLLERHRFCVVEAQNPRQAFDIIQSQLPFDLVITEFNMPVMNGDMFITKLRSEYSRQDLGIIGISSKGDKTVSIKMLKAGANDFITRPFAHEEFYCRVNQNIDAIVSYHKVEDLAFKDFLTGLYNRHFLFNQGKKVFNKAKKNNDGVAVAMMDIDFFKRINDTYGHQTGDDVLQFVAQEIADKFASGNHVVARVGGEEFCVICADLDVNSTIEMFESLRTIIEITPVIASGQSINVSMSIGVTFDCMDTLESAIIKADALLYQAKEGGRNQVVSD